MIYPAHSYHGDGYGFLNLLGRLEKKTGGERRGREDVRGGACDPHRDVDCVDACLFSHARDEARFVDRPAARDFFFSVHPEQKRKSRTQPLADPADDREGKPHPVVEASAEFVDPLIRIGGHELRKEVAVRAVDLHCIEPRVSRAHRGVAEFLDEPINLFRGELTRHGPADRTGDGRGRDRLGTPDYGREGLPARMGDLERDARPMIMDGLRQLPHSG